MRIAAAAAILSLAACGWSNPYDTADLEWDLENANARVLDLQRDHAWAASRFPADPAEGLGDLDPNLDAWRASDVQKADGDTLVRMIAETKYQINVHIFRLTQLEVESRKLAYPSFPASLPQDHPHRVLHVELERERERLRIEKWKLAYLMEEFNRRSP
jgi:hypothetical protein